MAIVDALSRALTSANTGFDVGSLGLSRANPLARGAASPQANSTRTFSVAESQDALNSAVSGARSILEALTSIRDLVRASDGLKSPLTYYADGRTGLQSEIQRLSRKINDLAGGSGRDINLLGDPSTTFKLRSTALGGTLSVVSQPLDSFSLGIDALDVTTQSGTEAALKSMTAAIQTASDRYRLLADAAAGLPSAGSFRDGSSSLSTFVSSNLFSGGTNTASRGALVNIRG